MRIRLLLALAGLCAGTLAGRAQDTSQEMTVILQGRGTATTRPIIMQRPWHAAYESESGIRIEADSSDLSVSSILADSFNTSSDAQKGTTDTVRKIGGFTLKVQTKGAWQIKIVETGFAEDGDFRHAPTLVVEAPTTPSPLAVSPSPPASAPSSPPNSPPVAPTVAAPAANNAPVATSSTLAAPRPAAANAAPAAPIPTPGGSIVAPTSSQDRSLALVLVRGDKAEGTGFLVRMPTGPVVVTNIHVISANPHIHITTTAGAEIPILSLKGATDRDLALFAIKDAGYTYLDLAADVGSAVVAGDDVVTPGNSQGADVILNTIGKVYGMGPQRLEFSNPVFHGNSGGPVIHSKSGKVVAVVTEALKVDTSNELDKNSYDSRNSAITGSFRYFGLRLDTVPGWEPYDWRRFLDETQMLENFHKESQCLDCFLNSENGAKAQNGLALTDERIRTAYTNFHDRMGDGSGDYSQRLDVVRLFLFDLVSVADINYIAVQNPNNFYGFDRQRAKQEADYRKALKAELDSIGNDVTRLGGLAHQSL